MYFKKNKYQLLTVLLIAIIILLSCKNNLTSSDTPFDDRIILKEGDYKKINLTLVDYNAVNIQHKLGYNLRSQNIVKIGIGSKYKGQFNELYYYKTSYDPITQSYGINYDYQLKINQSNINTPLTIRYYNKDNTYVDADTTIAMYKYPYERTEVVVDSTLSPNNYFQDIALVGDKLFFHPFGSDGIYLYDLISKTKTDFIMYLGGDNIAADSNYLFYDEHWVVYRFKMNSNGNLLTNLLTLSNSVVMGMSIYNSDLYLYSRKKGNTYLLERYNYDGQLLETIPYGTAESSYIAINDGIVYSVNWKTNGPDTINRFDLQTKKYLSSIKSPAYSIDGIKFYNGKLYYCDWLKKCVSSVPIVDLVELK